MAKVLFAGGVISFIAALIVEIAFILLKLTATDAHSDGSPSSIPVFIVWGCIGIGVLSWIIAAAFLLIGYFRNRA